MHQTWIQLNQKNCYTPIIATAHLDLVHIDFTFIEVSGDDNLHTTPTVILVLVITNHFTRHSMAFIMKDQKASIIKLAYKNYICIFEAPTRLHSDQGANFTSTVIAELCSLLGIQKSKMTPYCPPKQWESGKDAPKSHQDDRQVAWPKESKLASTSTWSNTGIQQYSIHYYGL